MVVHVWNEDLVNAMNARHQQAWQQQRRSQYKWRDGAKAIEAVRKDIRLTSTGKIYNLPTQNSKSFVKTVYEECVNIIKGEAPIYPPGFTPLNPAERKQILEDSAVSAAFSPYIEQMQRESGGYAILLAFHFSQRDNMTKDEICRIGQDYCKEQMSENYHAGRMFGAWKGNETLARHGLITVHKAGARWTERGFRSNGKHTYMITADGKTAIQQILRKWPDIDVNRRNSTSTSTGIASTSRSPFRSSVSTLGSVSGSVSTPIPSAAIPIGEGGHFFGHAGGIPLITRTPRAVKRHIKSTDDEKVLRDWINSPSTSIGAQKVLKLGKERRLYIHKLCDQLESENPGLRLEHHSVSVGQRGRHLYVTLRGKHEGKLSSMQSSGSSRKCSASASAARGGVTGARRILNTAFTSDSPRSVPESTMDINKKRSHAAISIPMPMTPPPPISQNGHKLGTRTCSANNTVKKRRSAAKVAAGRAALARFEQHSLNVNANVDGNPNIKASPIVNLNRNAVKSSPVIEILSDDDSKLPPTKEAFHDYQPGEYCRMRSGGGQPEYVDLDLDLDQYPGPFRILRVHIDGHVTVENPEHGETKLNVRQVQPCDAGDAVTKSTGKPKPKRGTRKGTINNSSRSHMEDEVIELLDDEDDSIEIIEPSRQAQRSTSTDTDTSNLTILIDDRERSRNHKPREMRIELTKEAQHGCLKDISSADVQERKLQHGDFAFEVTDGQDSKQLSVLIERKRVADLIQRSAYGDHWKQLGRMRDNCQHAIMLIEGDSKVAQRFDPYGIQNRERKVSHHIIENDEDLFVFVGRSIISSPKVKFAQTRDERGTYRFVNAVGIIAKASPKINRTEHKRAASCQSEQNRLQDRLISGGVDWKIAKEVAFQFGSVGCLENTYQSCNSVEAKHLLLEPILRNSVEQDQLGRIDMWSRTIFEAFTATDEVRTQKRRQFEDIINEVGEDTCDAPTLMHFLYYGNSPDGALNATLDYTDAIYSTEHRKVYIECSQTLGSCFEKPTDQSFYKLSLHPNSLPVLPVVKFLTQCESMRSDQLLVYVLEGSDLVKDVCSSLKGPFVSDNLVRVAKVIADKINDNCKTESESTQQPSNKTEQNERRVLLIRGLGPALGQAAKSSDFRIETTILCDMLMASLMFDHDIIVLQAIRKNISETSMILRQIALACYHYHLLPNRLSDQLTVDNNS